MVISISIRDKRTGTIGFQIQKYVNIRIATIVRYATSSTFVKGFLFLAGKGVPLVICVNYKKIFYLLRVTI